MPPMPRPLEAAGWAKAQASGDLIPLEEKAETLSRRVVNFHLTPEGLLAYRIPVPYVTPPVAQHSDTLAWSSLWALAQGLAVRSSTVLEPEVPRPACACRQGGPS